MNMTLEFGKKMISHQKPGVFLNISTTCAETGSGYVVPSAVAKAGCNNLTKSLGAGGVNMVFALFPWLRVNLYGKLHFLD